VKFTRAIVRTPGTSMIFGLSSAGFGPPNYTQALVQHGAYVQALKACGLEVTVLPPDEEHPDSTFVEDTALLTPECAIIMRPGATSRRDETESIEPTLRDHFKTIEPVQAPGTVDAGDIMMVGRHFFIGLSQRTNAEGAKQILEILNRHGLSGSTVPLKEMLHLKSGVAYLENDTLVATGEFLNRSEFAKFKVIPILSEEAYAANCLWLNGTVLVAAGFPQAKKAVETAGYQTIALEMSEFRKLDGGLSCLSLRW